MRIFCFICLFVSLKIFALKEESYTLLSLPEAEYLNNNTTRIPFKLVDHLMVIEAELLNQKGNFIIDTGSESLILNKAHFKGYQSKTDLQNKTAGVLQEIDNPLERRLREFIIQDMRIRHKSSDVIDLSHLETNKKIHILGIIGYDLLKDYEVFVDMHLRQITLSRTDKKGNKIDKFGYLEKIIDTVDFRLRHHTIVIDAHIDSKKLKFGIDTAAELNQLNASSNPEVLKYFFPKQRLHLTDAGGKKMEVMAGKLYRVKLTDNIYFGPMHTILSNLSQMEKAFGVRLDGILGYEFFKQQRVIINYKKEKLYFVEKPIYRE